MAANNFMRNGDGGGGLDHSQANDPRARGPESGASQAQESRYAQRVADHARLQAAAEKAEIELREAEAEKAELELREAEAEVARLKAEAEVACLKAEAEVARLRVEAEAAAETAAKAARKRAEAAEATRRQAMAVEAARRYAEEARLQAEAAGIEDLEEIDQQAETSEENFPQAEAAEVARQQAEAAEIDDLEELDQQAEAAEGASQDSPGPQSACQPSYDAERAALFAPNADQKQASREALQTSLDSNPKTKKGKSGRHGGSARKRIIAIIAALLVALVAVFGVSGAIVIAQAQAMISQKDDILAKVDSIKTNAEDGDADALKANVSSIASTVSDLNETTHNPFWTIVSVIPVIGDDTRAASGLTEQADKLCQEALIPASDALAGVSLSDLVSSSGINTSELQTVIDAVTSVAPVVTECTSAIQDLPEPHAAKLKSLFEQMEDPLDVANELFSNVNTYGPILQQMLGTDGARTYLVVAQNNAEMRSTGGLPGSMGLVTVDNGNLSFGEFIDTSSTINDAGGADLYGITEEETALFGERVGTVTSDTNFIPDFERAGYLFGQIWEHLKGDHVDGVIAVDPVFVQYMLKLVGGLEVNGVTLDGDNAAEALLNYTYNNIPDDQTAAFFTQVANDSANHILNNLGNASITDLVKTVKKGVAGQHLIAWMLNADEEQALKDLDAAGALVTDSSTPQLGVFLSDDACTKKGWFLSGNTEVSDGTTNADGTITYHVSTTFTNNLTKEQASTQDTPVIGDSSLARSDSDMVDWVYLVAPAGGTISNVSATGADLSLMGFREMSYNGFQVMEALSRINYGETLTITYDVTCAAGSSKLTVRQQATAQEVAGWE
jgi:hypothetical protein